MNALRSLRGRVAATGPALRDAIDKAYRGVGAISFSGCFSRSDIGKKGLR
jgi:phosphoribosylamine-glycine ligase